MQTTNKNNLIERSRYYLSLSDTENLKPGEEYNKVKNTYIIFICDYDLFNKGEAKYIVREHIEKENGEFILDTNYNGGYAKIYLNLKADLSRIQSRNLKDLIQYMNMGIPSSKLTKELDEEVKKIKNSSIERRKYMTLQYYFEQEHEKGKEENAKEIAIKLLKRGKDTVKEISKLTSLSIKEINELKKQLS